MLKTLIQLTFKILKTLKVGIYSFFAWKGMPLPLSG